MKVITLTAVAVVLLFELTGTLSKPALDLTVVAVFLSAGVAVGLHDAWRYKRGFLGWVVSLTLAVVGGLIGSQIGRQIFGFLFTMPYVLLRGPAAASDLLWLLPIFSVVSLLETLLGASLALRLFRSLRRPQPPTLP